MKNDFERVTVVDHPLVQQRLTTIRDKRTPTKHFRALVREIALFEGFEALREIETQALEVETPIANAQGLAFNEEELVIVPVLRAGLGMVEGMLDLLPGARVGHLGLFRNEETKEPVEYYSNFPADIADCKVIIVDPMLATGGSAVAAIRQVRERGVKDEIMLLVMVAAPQGIEAVLNADQNVSIVTCSIDEGLNEDAYIVPGLGDAGDRIFGTVV